MVTPFETPVQQAARCLADDPSFRLLGSLEEQRAEARLLLQGIPGGAVDDADEAIMLALELAGGEADVEEVSVSKADYGEGVWKERKIKVRRPKLSVADTAIPPPKPLRMTQERAIALGIIQPPKRPPKPKKPKLSAADRKRQRQVDQGTLNRFRAATGMSLESLASMLGKSRPTVQFYLNGTILWVPKKIHLQALRNTLESQKRLVEENLAEFEAILAAYPED